MKAGFHSLLKNCCLILLVTLGNPAAAITLNGQVIVYNDPSNYLGLSGVALGSSASTTFTVDPGAIPSSTYTFPDSENEYFFSSTATNPGSFTINGTTISGPNLNTIVVGNDITGGPITTFLGPGDFYSYNQFYTPPSAAWTSIFWQVSFHDSTSSLLNNDNFFALDSASGWDSIFLSARLWNATTQTEQVLLAASLAPVPLPACLWLFLSAA